MPNWCSNRVTIYADNQEQVRTFTEFVTKEFKGTDEDGRPWSRIQPFSFEAFLPIPEELMYSESPTVIVGTLKEVHEHRNENEGKRFYSGSPITQEMSDRFKEEYKVDNWYDWCYNNWGVKWDCSSVEVDYNWDDLIVVYRFDTPWGPPQEIYDVLTTKFPNLRLTWFWDEPGCEQAGYLQ